MSSASRNRWLMPRLAIRFPYLTILPGRARMICLLIRSIQSSPIFNVPNAPDRRPVAKILEFQVNSYRFAVDIIPASGHSYSKRERPYSGRCSVFGPATSWDTQYNGTQLGNSLLSTLKREFLSSHLQRNSIRHIDGQAIHFGSSSKKFASPQSGHERGHDCIKSLEEICGRVAVGRLCETFYGGEGQVHLISLSKWIY